MFKHSLHLVQRIGGGRMYLLQLSQSTTRTAAALTFTSTWSQPKTAYSSIGQWEGLFFQSVQSDASVYIVQLSKSQPVQLQL